MKNRRFLLLLLAAALLIGFLAFRNGSETASDLTGPLVSAVLSEADGSSSGGAEISLAQEIETDLPETEQPSSSTSVSQDLPDASDTGETASPSAIDRDGTYDSKEDVALYIHTYGELPPNYITKDEAKAAGWSGSGSDRLEKYCPGKCIGGDRFGNREGLLPAAKGRTWTECDIDTLGARNRGVKRIVFSNDGLIYYTGDHYDSFELLYGNP